MPGSQADIVQHPSAAALLKFYRAYYRPERAVLTVVGDIDPGQLEAQIAAGFSDWTGVAESGRLPVFKVPQGRGLETRIHVEAAAQPRVVLTWIQPPLSHPINRAGWRRQNIESVAWQIVNRRLAALAASAEHPFVNAGAGEREQRNAARLIQLSAACHDGDWRKALEALVRSRQALLQGRVSQAEIDSAVAAQKAARQREDMSAGTRTTPALANMLSSDAEADEITVAPSQARAVGDEDQTGLAPAIIAPTLKDMIGAGDPLIFVSATHPVEGGDAAVRDAYRAAVQISQPLAAAAAPAQWSYTDFGPPGRMVETGGAPDLGVSSFRFGNNVRLLVRPSKARENQVQVSVKIGDGRAGLARDGAATGWLFGGLLPGGLGALSTTDMVTALSGKSYRIGFGLGDGAFSFSGETTPGDLETQLQVMAAYIKDAGYRAEAFEQFRQQLLRQLRVADATPQGAMAL